MSCGVGCRCGSDPTWLWLWHRPEATAPIRPLWEPSHASGVALKRQNTKQQQQKKTQPPPKKKQETEDLENLVPRSPQVSYITEPLHVPKLCQLS